MILRTTTATATPLEGVTTTARKRQEPDEADFGSGSDDRSTASDPLEVEPAPFDPPDDPSISPELDEFEPPPPQPIEWTPERAGAIIRGFGFLLHTADPLARAPGGDDLWRATDEDADAIGSPLSRILNRYAPARRLAGVADEGELAFGLIAYTRRNLSLRGDLIDAEKEAAERAEHGQGGDLFHEPPAEPPA